MGEAESVFFSFLFNRFIKIVIKLKCQCWRRNLILCWDENPQRCTAMFGVGYCARVFKNVFLIKLVRFVGFICRDWARCMESEWASKRMIEWTSERVNEWVNKWVSERPTKSQCKQERKKTETESKIKRVKQKQESVHFRDCERVYTMSSRKDSIFQWKFPARNRN